MTVANSVDAATLWEYRGANGNNANGGGFSDLDPGTSVDFSNQDDAEHTYNNLSTGGIGSTTLTDGDAGGTLGTADNVGNCIQMTGGAGSNLTDGWFQITARITDDQVTIHTAADDGTGGVTAAAGSLGGALKVLIDDFFDSAGAGIAAGNTVHVNSEAMTLTGSVSTTLTGSATAAITITGYNAARGDNPLGANRPTITAAASAFLFSSHFHVRNLIVATTAADGLRVGANGVVDNCQVTNSSGTSNRVAIRLTSSRGLAARCQSDSVNGDAVKFDVGSSAIACYFHDSTTGVDIAGGDNSLIMGCVIDGCTAAGIVGTTNSTANRVANTTLYDCLVGISVGTGGAGWIVVNNIFDNCPTEASFGDTSVMHWDFNATDPSPVLTNVTEGDNNLAADSGLVNPAALDFTLGSGSNAIDAGLKITTDTGVATSHKWNIGADQDDVAAGGAAGHATMTGGMQ